MTNSDELIIEKIPLEQLATWRSLDKGQVSIKDDYLVLEELPGSDGYFLVSPENYEGDVIVQYKLKPISESSVMIVLLSASDNAESLELKLPSADAKPEEFWDWRSSMNHYNITFNNESHNYKPFMYKNINQQERGFNLRVNENVVKPGSWYDIETGVVDGRIWLKIDGEYIFNHTDPEPLKGGHIIFRISGTNGENVILAKSAIKSLVIHHK